MNTAKVVADFMGRKLDILVNNSGSDTYSLSDLSVCASACGKLMR
jgi:hypothetical protein